MKKARVPILLLTLSIPVFMCAGKNVGAVSGSMETVIQAGSTSTPSYAVVSAGITGDPIYTGQIESTPTTTTVHFESSSDSSETIVNPFISGVFNSSVKTPILTASLSGSGVGSISYAAFAGEGFTTAPEIIIDFPVEGDDQATATCTVSSGAINGITITNAGSGYDAAPTVTVVGGPHFLKLTESGDDDEGRVFLITDNNETRLTLDISSLVASETLDDILQDDFSVEVVPATTLGSVFGTTVAECDLKEGLPASSDYVYLWNSSRQFYVPHYFRSPGTGAYPVGWYNRLALRAGMQNDFVLLPDEGFIIGRRTNQILTLSFDGSSSSVEKKLRLPTVNNQVVINNPYGGDLLLAEIIPTQYIGTGANEFRPGSDEDDAQADQLYFLRANGASAWSRYWYQSGYNDGVTAVATATAKAGSGGSGALTANDVSLASGTITNLQSCNASGSIVDHNVSDHTLITLSASNAPLAGFDVTFKGVFGKKLNDNGDKELDINGTEVTAGGGINIFSGLIGTYKIIRKHAANKIVVRKQRDVNFDSSKGAKSWSTGNVGAGYSTNSSKKAKVYFLGGGGTGAHGTFFNADNPKVTVVSGGSGYTSAPQAIITGGGWRLENAGASVEDNATLGATEGMIILRKNPSGALTYIKGSNPFQ
jgi:hypothetical protein